MKYFSDSTKISTFTTAKIQMAQTVTAIADDIALTFGGHKSPTNNHGIRFIPIP